MIVSYLKTKYHNGQPTDKPAKIPTTYLLNKDLELQRQRHGTRLGFITGQASIHKVNAVT
jgi:hypothetical protein